MISHTFFTGEVLGLFVDGAHLSQATRQLDFEVDLDALRKIFASAGNLLCSYYYIALKSEGPNEASTAFLDMLQDMGWRTVSKPFRTVGEPGSQVVKGSFEIEMTVDMMEQSQSIDHAVLISGNGDFTYLIDYLQRDGIRVTMVSSEETPKPLMSKDLRRQADAFIDLADLKPYITRTRAKQSDG